MFFSSVRPFDGYGTSIFMLRITNTLKEVRPRNSNQTHNGERYRLHELMRQYAAKRLAVSGEVDRLRTRHVQFYLQLAEEAEVYLTGADQALRLDRLDAEKDNFREV